MARAPSVAGVRVEVICSRFTAAEAADIDRLRGSLSRAEWVRWLVLKARKEQG